MTTIAYRNGVIASDSQATNSDAYVGNVTKIYKFGPILASFAGSYPLCLKFIDWIRDGLKNPLPSMFNSEMDVSAAGFIFLPTGKILTMTTLGLDIMDAEYFAAGSGRDYALGAMANGATPEQAVAAAIKHDLMTGGQIQILRSNS